MPKTSIIVPVYNTEKQLEKCLNSLVEQTKQDIEIILINDGSTDGSKEIMERYQKQYIKKIRYYEKPNSGIADSRNYGIDKATGEYIVFVDSDDYIEKDLLEKLEPYQQKNIDLIKYKCVIEDIKGKEIQTIDGPTFDTISGEEGFNQLYYQDRLLDSPCLYAIKKELFTKSNLKFKVGAYHEDFGLIPLIILQAKTMVSIPFYAYHYIQSDNSITRNQDDKKTIQRAYDSLIHYDQMLKQIKIQKLQTKTIENIKIYYTNSILLKIEELKPKDQKQYIQEIRKRKMTKNIKARNLKQVVKKVLLTVNIKLYLKLR